MVATHDGDEVYDAIRSALLAHYRHQARDLPWRRTRDPYRVWVSEIMLQQTRVATVAERYQRFLSRFPDLAALASAPLHAVCEEWAGLGYYGRARNLHRAARQIRHELGGRFPSAPADLERLPGIGPYTAAAIASIVFDHAVAAVDGNAERVLSRVFAIGSRRDGSRRVEIVRHARAIVASGRAGEINQALMDVGALLCRPTAPACRLCPLARRCRAHAEGDPLRYPPARPGAAVRRLRVAFAWLETPAGVWLERRDTVGLWSGTWQLPGQEGRDARDALAARLGVDLDRRLATVRHALSHRQVTATVYRPAEVPRMRRRDGRRIYSEPLTAPLNGLARKAIAAVVRSPPAG